MKNLTLMFAALVLISSSESFAAGMHDKTPTELQQLWAANQQKCKQNIENTRQLLAPSDSKRRAASDALRGVLGKDTKEGVKEAATKKLNEYEMQQQNDASQITTLLTTIVGTNANSVAIENAEKKIMDHAMKCDKTTADLSKSAQ